MADLAHGGRGVEEEQEEHAAPGDDVEAVEGDEEAGGREEPFPEGSEANERGCRPGEFGGWGVAVGIGGEGVEGGVSGVVVGTVCWVFGDGVFGTGRSVVGGRGVDVCGVFCVGGGLRRRMNVVASRRFLSNGRHAKARPRSVSVSTEP